jgi:hypothetical protein
VKPEAQNGAMGSQADTHQQLEEPRNRISSRTWEDQQLDNELLASRTVRENFFYYFEPLNLW